VVGIVLTLRDGRSRVRISAEARYFSFTHIVLAVSGAQPASYSMGIWILPRGIKRQLDQVDHSPPSSAENDWSYTYTPLTRLHGVDRGSVTFYLCLYLCLLCKVHDPCVSLRQNADFLNITAGGVYSHHRILKG
jgi:hypothetical protein